MSERTQPPVAPILPEARYAHVVIREYGCVKCQRWHREGEADRLYEAHMCWQARNAYREIHVEDAIAELGKK